jgi:hypothetical protein
MHNAHDAAALVRSSARHGVLHAHDDANSMYEAIPAVSIEPVSIDKMSKTQLKEALYKALNKKNSMMPALDGIWPQGIGKDCHKHAYEALMYPCCVQSYLQLAYNSLHIALFALLYEQSLVHSDGTDRHEVLATLTRCNS